MKLQRTQYDYIKSHFQKLETKEDLLNLLNYAKEILYGKRSYTFKLNQLTYHSNPRANSIRYQVFAVKKKNGGVRTIHAPVKGLKEIQKALNLVLQCVFEAHPSASGFVPGKSIRDNALTHSGNYYVYNIDLKDFFFSIDQARVWKCFQLPPFNLGRINAERDLNNRPLEVVNIISALCCAEIEVQVEDFAGSIIKIKKNVVPQGAPTSPIITNVICQRLDYLLTAVAKRFGLKYSRYADDITFSSLHYIYEIDGPFINEVERIVTQQGFSINQSKTRLQKSGERQIVTGLVVNNKVNVPSSFTKRIRSWLYMWERYGYDRANIFFLNDYINNKGHIKTSTPNMTKVLIGKLQYLKMIKGEEDSVYQKLNARFQVLLVGILKGSLTDKIINYWEHHGFRATREYFFSQLAMLSINELLEKLIAETADDTDKKQKLIKLIQSEIACLDKTNTPSIKTPMEVAVSNFDRANMPKRVADFMSLFDDPDGLKYLTHDFDESDRIFDIQYFLPKAKKVFEQSTKLGKLTIPSSLWAIVNEFAFVESPSWNKGCKDGWSKPDRVQWAIEEKKHLKRNVTFAVTIETFRKLTRIEAPELKNLLIKIIKEKIGPKYADCKVQLIDCEKADFYTHVGYFSEAMMLLLDGFCKRLNEHNQLSVIYSRGTVGEYRARIITVTHINSFPMKPLDDFLHDIEKGKGELADVRAKLEGYCDWYIETIWDEQPMKITLLGTGDLIERLPENELTIKRIVGFSHTLTFYQK